MIDKPRHTPAFPCSHDRFKASARDELLGSFDGRDRRSVMLYAMQDRQEQLFVSLHELLHHELQWSTAWGILSAMAGLLAESSIGRLGVIARAMHDSCRTVHEIFATTVSSGVVGIPAARRMLGTDETYRQYLDAGVLLGGDPDQPWQFRESAIQMVLRATMQPAAVATIAERGFRRIRLEDVCSLEATPDERLRRIRDVVPTWWDGLFTELATTWPERGGDLGDENGRRLPEDPMALLALKEWEETVLLPAVLSTAGRRLAELGLPTLDESGYAHVVEELQQSFSDLAPESWAVELFVHGRGVADEPLGVERESAVLYRDPAGLEIVAPDAFEGRVAEFRAESGSETRVLAMYSVTGALRRQFAGLPEQLPAERATLMLLGNARNESGQRIVPIAFMQPELSPAALATTFTRYRCVVLTTLRTTRETLYRHAILETPMPYVIIDLPLKRQLATWVDQALRPRYRIFHLGSDRHVNLVVFGVDEIPGCWFLCYRSDAGFGDLMRVVEEYSDVTTSDLQVPADVIGDIGAITTWLLTAWWRFEETE